jgi:peptidoglycan/LPS O-acetylase OafA/YrhL
VGRMALIDALKSVCSQLIVLHHLAFYGPMSDYTQQLFPWLIEWLSQHARIVVQVFLVMAGFLAARSLAPDGRLRSPQPLALLRKRYLRTALPLIAAVLLGVAGAEVARHWMVHDSIPARPELLQLLAHALLVQSLLDVDSLSAGVWYVAIDFQLFALLLLLLWLARAGSGGLRAALGVTAIGVLLSVYHFNRDSHWDVWAIYFFGAYGMGAIAWWLGSQRDAARARLGLLLLAVLVAVALWLDFRTRLALALATALLLALSLRGGWLQRWPAGHGWAYFSDISYAVFLLNFPVALVVNAAFRRFAAPDPWVQTAGLVLAWMACNVAGAAFHRWVEVPLGRIGAGRVR